MFRSKSFSMKSIASFLSLLLLLNISAPLNLMAMDASPQNDTEIPMQGMGQTAPPADPGLMPPDDAGPIGISPYWLGVPSFFAFAFMFAMIGVIIAWKTHPCDNSTEVNDTICNETIPQCYELVRQFQECVIAPLCFVNQTNL